MEDKHDCGGTILIGGTVDQEHTYCDRCGAFRYGVAHILPTGTDPEANAEAWNAGDNASPAFGWTCRDCNRPLVGPNAHHAVNCPRYGS